MWTHLGVEEPWIVHKCGRCSRRKRRIAQFGTFPPAFAKRKIRGFGTIIRKVNLVQVSDAVSHIS